ncbi:MAG TPA: hypothetical protein DCG47_10550 [Spirochaetaceae bacterium]|jgi:hypothetical protein|nr:hypothetical protein [Spirochaetaceae bacterium]
MIGPYAKARASLAFILFGLGLLVPLEAQASFKPDELRASVLKLAASFKGVPYKYGAESPYAFDCSGFVRYVYREAAGIDLPRSARSYTAVGRAVKQSDALPGDIFIFNTVGNAASHVALYTGGGRLIHAVSDGPNTGVIESPLSDRYWGSRVIGVRSVIAASERPTAAAAPATAGTAPSAAGAVPAKPAPAAKPASPAAERSIADIGFDIAPSRQLINDPIPTQAGTSLAFTVTNTTGKAGDFIILFYVVEPKTLTIREIHREKVRLAAGASYSLPPYAFDAPGKYKLAVKGEWGSLLLERGFEVVAAK